MATVAPLLLLVLFLGRGILLGQGCIARTDGWSPMTITDRTRRADVVISALARHTYKHDSASEDTYTAEFRLLDVLKGTRVLRAVRPDAMTNGRRVNASSPMSGRVYNISNFGEKALCYSSVVAGQSYILFLTTGPDGRLEVQYDDIFGGAAEWSESNVKLVLKGVGLGWGSWSDWSPCSVTCGEGGFQQRRRICSEEKKCDGYELERRSCNNLKCKAIRDLLKIFSFKKSGQRGVQSVVDRQGAYRLERSSYLRLPTYTLFPTSTYFPSVYALLATIRCSESGCGNFLGITDKNGRRRLALRLGTTIEFTYLSAPGHQTLRQKPAYFRLNSNLMNYQWHTIGMALQRDSIYFYVDCQLHSSFVVNRTYAGKDIPLSSIMTIGYLPKSLKELNFEGDIEQLLISTDPKAVEQQCGTTTKVSDPEIWPEDEGVRSPEGSGDNEVSEGSGNEQFEIEWSEWSQCSVTCGRGFRKRSSQCQDNGQNLEECIEAHIEKSETGICQLQPCPKPGDRGVIVKKPSKTKPKIVSIFQESTESECHKCLNGANCVDKRKCVCPPGFYGNHCEHVSCPECLNGGKCLVNRNKCVCLNGFEGDRCQDAACAMPCQNGGRCIGPQRCSCLYGYAPPNCTPICNPPCYNGGVCLAPSKCKCLPGYTGNSCQTAICKNGCKNGGRCVLPDKCACPSGYTGTECDTPICPPSCQNGGICIKPYTCLCKSGFSGVFCERFACNPTCLNGGTCVGPNKCSCLPYYTGTECQTVICKDNCLNGGKCITPSKCICPSGFSGLKCEKRNCKKYQLVREPYIRSYKKKVQKTVKEACGVLKWKTCTKSKTDYEMVQKTFYRTAYKCTD